MNSKVRSAFVKGNNNWRNSLNENHTISLKDFLQARIHESFTLAADKLAQLGIIVKDDRIKISTIIGECLKKFDEDIVKETRICQITIPQETIDKLVFD